MESTQAVKGINATELLREDHRQLQELFSLFESESDHREKKSIGQRALKELQAHSIIEEEVFYPAALRVLGDEQLIIDSQEAHHVAKVLMKELKLTPAGERYNGKFRALMENIRDHIAREEEVLLPKMERSGVDLKRLGSKMEACRYEALTGSKLTGGNFGRNAVIFSAVIAAAALLIKSARAQQRY